MLKQQNSKDIRRIKVIDREKRMPASQQLKIPFSGCTRRRFIAHAVTKNRKTVILADVVWSLSSEVNGVTIDADGLLIITPHADEATIHIIAQWKQQPHIRGETKVHIIQTSGQDMPPNPLQKDGWKLYANDEFDTNVLDRSMWADQYLRNWSDDIGSNTNYFFENGSIVVKADTDSKRWSPYDPNENSSITSFEKTYLHRFGENVYESSRIIPTYDGLATKYGYFEIRAKLPDTGDGSHVAWWMIGVQDDQNIDTQITDPTVTDLRSSNETGEVDIIEIGLNELTSWRPVMHPNESTSLEYLHVAETKLNFDPGNEFHIYGFEWNEHGTKYYVDNQLVQETDRTFDYRMMTFLGLYPQGGMGKANKIFPKEFAIDYFRVYKKDEQRAANDITFSQTSRPYAFKKPLGNRNKKYSLSATVVDQFDNPLSDKAATLVWQFSQNISGDHAKKVHGASIDPKTGEITLTDEVSGQADLFITAKVKENLKVKKVCHIKVSNAPEKPVYMQFDHAQKVIDIHIPKDKDVVVKEFTASVIDQYGKTFETHITWKLATGTTLKDSTNIKGVLIDPESGTLTITNHAKAETYVFVLATSYIQAKESDIHGLDQTIYAHQLIRLI